MEILLSDLALSMSEFKKNPAAVLRTAQGRPVAVLNHNKVGFYVLEPALMNALLDLSVQPAAAGLDPGDITTKRELIADLLRQIQNPAL